jgi:PilX N-terminal
MMKNQHKIICEEGGAVLITVLLIMALISIIGVSATDTTSFELQIANNDKRHKIVKYHVDAGFGALAKLINKAMEKETMSIDLGKFAITSDSSVILDQLGHYTDYDPVLDLQYAMDGTTVDLDVFQFAVAPGPGSTSSPEFVTGPKYSGLKSGGGPNLDTHFIIRAWGSDAGGTTAYIEAAYIKPMNNSAGGL